MRTAIALVSATVLSAAPVAAQPRLTMDWQAIAERLVAQLDPQPREQILLLSRPGNFDEILPQVRYALMKAGARLRQRRRSGHPVLEARRASSVTVIGRRRQDPGAGAFDQLDDGIAGHPEHVHLGCGGVEQWILDPAVSLHHPLRQPTLEPAAHGRLAE